MKTLYHHIQHTARLFCLAALVVACALLSSPSYAQFDEGRLTITNDTKSINIGRYMHITPDRDGALTYNAIISRHINNIRGERYNRNILSLGYPANASWILFTVDNQTNITDWVLDFGALAGGRQAMATKLLVRNHTRGESYARAMREKGRAGANGEGIESGVIPIKITPASKELFVLYVEASGPFAQTINPRISLQNHYVSNGGLAKSGAALFTIALLAIIMFLVALSAIHRNKPYLLFAGYFVLIGLIWGVIQNIFVMRFELLGNALSILAMLTFTLGVFVSHTLLNITREDRKEQATLYLLMLTGLVGAAAIGLLFNAKAALHVPILTSIMLVIPLALVLISAQQAKYGNRPAFYIALGWAANLAGAIITLAATAQFIALSPLFINAYWFGILAQGVCFVLAVFKHADLIMEEEHQMRARAGREAQTMMRLRQSKESADQARLLRVIEREREVLAELREREMQRTEEMRKAKEVADSANDAKSAFLAVVSHEVRTPMTGVMGMVKLLLGTKLSKEQHEYTTAIKNSGETMMVLLNDILDFEKIESGNMQLEMIDFDFTNLVEGVKTLMSGHASGKDISLTTDIPPDFPRFVKGDPTRIRQVILNLTNNAIKFTEEGGVTLKLKAITLENKPASVVADYEISFIVEDTGIGIPEEARQKLFTPFTQADESTTRKYGGTGLGLAICKKIVDAMSGTIGVNSVEGQGSTFFFNLLMEKGDQTLAAEHNTALAPSEVQQDNEKTLHILIIEDNDVNRRVLHGMLEQKGHKTAMAKDGAEALSLIADHTFDLIISDINMDGMDGFETTARIRDLPDENKSQTPIIALTGNVQDSDIESYYAAGMNGFLAKPIDTDKLYEIVDLAANDALVIRDRAEQSKAPPPSPEVIPAPEPTKAADPFPFPDDNDVYVPAPPPKKKSAPAPAISMDAVDTSDLSIDDEEKETGSPASDDKSDGPEFNQSMLMNLLETLGKVPFNELLNSYYEQADVIIDALEGALNDEDFKVIHDRGHEMKGMAANFGMTGLATIAKHIERAGKDKDMNTAKDNISQLSPMNTTLKKAVTAWLNDL